jgi:hypothetical protein
MKDFLLCTVCEVTVETMRGGCVRLCAAVCGCGRLCAAVCGCVRLWAAVCGCVRLTDTSERRGINQRHVVMMLIIMMIIFYLLVASLFLKKSLH